MDRIEAVLGYTIKELHARLLHTMPAGHTWDDFLSGALHIDHEIPLAAFNFISEDDYDFKRAWALSNLRLLPAAANFAKGDRLLAAFQPCLV